MTMEEIIAFVERLDGALAVQPGPGDGSPEISWGDTFFFYSPEGGMPKATQPFATIVTKDQPGDDRSRLDRPDTFRVNIGAGRSAFIDWTGHAPREPAVDDDPGMDDAVIAHPVYASLGWVAVVNPGRGTDAAVRELLRNAYHRARARHERRADSTS
ncbi:DUF6194 family protein [Streptomyces sp. ALB3]|uniref:DUF6194 family protein n=1 Tax=Streptomyces sp. ALB3 TaxID=3374278 RepID=UPI0037AA7EE8